MLSENERDPIKVFDPESPVFLACVIALSIFLILCLVGCGMGVFLTKYLNRKKMDISAPDNSSGELKLMTGTRAFRPPHEHIHLVFEATLFLPEQKLEFSQSICI